MQRRCGPKRDALRPAMLPTIRSRRADRRRRKTAPAATAPEGMENCECFASPAAAEPLRDADLDGAGEKRQQLGSEPWLESVGGAGANTHQPDRRRTAKGKPQQCLRADEPGRFAEQRRIAVDVGAKQPIALRAEQLVDGAQSQQVDAVER